MCNSCTSCEQLRLALQERIQEAIALRTKLAELQGAPGSVMSTRGQLSKSWSSGALTVPASPSGALAVPAPSRKRRPSVPQFDNEIPGPLPSPSQCSIGPSKSKDMKESIVSVSPRLQALLGKIEIEIPTTPANSTAVSDKGATVKTATVASQTVSAMQIACAVQTEPHNFSMTAASQTELPPQIVQSAAAVQTETFGTVHVVDASAQTSICSAFADAHAQTKSFGTDVASATDSTRQIDASAQTEADLICSVQTEELAVPSQTTSRSSVQTQTQVLSAEAHTQMPSIQRIDSEVQAVASCVDATSQVTTQSSEASVQTASVASESVAQSLPKSPSRASLGPAGRSEKEWEWLLAENA